MAVIPNSEDVTKVLNKNLRDQKPRKYPFAGINQQHMSRVFIANEDEPNIFLYSGKSMFSTGGEGLGTKVLGSQRSSSKIAIQQLDVSVSCVCSVINDKFHYNMVN